jgi:hypothetical protein
MPSASDGATDEQLSNIYNVFDIYVQYSICEGFGVPQIEAGACGVPVATVNYSAMEDIVHKLEAYSVNILCRFKELETQAIRVYPDNDHLIDVLKDYLLLPDPIKYQKRKKINHLTTKYFNWDNITNQWEKYFDSLISENKFGTWGDISQKDLIAPLNYEIINSDKLSNIQKLSYISNHIKYSGITIDSAFMLEILEKLDNGYFFENQKPRGYDWPDAINLFDTMISNSNICISSILDKTKIDEDFITYADLKDPNIQ